MENVRSDVLIVFGCPSTFIVKYSSKIERLIRKSNIPSVVADKSIIFTKEISDKTHRVSVENSFLTPGAFVLQFLSFGIKNNVRNPTAIIYKNFPSVGIYIGEIGLFYPSLIVHYLPPFSPAS